MTESGCRPLFRVIAGIAAAALAFTVLTYEDAPPEDHYVPWSPAVAGLAVSGCVAAFYGASELLTHRFTDAQTLAPLLGGLALIFVLAVWQYQPRRPVLPHEPVHHDPRKPFAQRSLTN